MPPADAAERDPACVRAYVPDCLPDYGRDCLRRYAWRITAILLLAMLATLARTAWGHEVRELATQGIEARIPAAGTRIEAQALATYLAPGIADYQSVASNPVPPIRCG
jgi:hypothetical protein